MQSIKLIQRSVVIAVFAAASGVMAGTAQAVTGRAALATQCATVAVKATPKLNTAMIPETIKSTVKSCATATETVTLTQKISGPHSGRTPLTKTLTITLAPGQAVTKTRSFPFVCCGTFSVVDHVFGSGGQQLAKASTSFTFA